MTEINKITNLIEVSGIKKLFGLELFMGKTRAGESQLEISGPAKRISLNSGNGLRQILDGDLKILIDRLATVTQALPGNTEAPELLGKERFKKSCFTEIKLEAEAASGNLFAAEIAGISSETMPVFYGSTSGINFAEVLETALCSQALEERGRDSTVVFDFDDGTSEESGNIFLDSNAILPDPLQERVVRFRKDTEGGLMGSRIKAIRELLKKSGSLPEVNLVNGRQIFEKLGKRFTLGQLLLLAKLAGNDPRLFEASYTPISARALISEAGSLEILAKPVSEFIAEGIRPAGFTYYAREAVTGSLGGIGGRPLKLTEKANIYKIMLSTTALFNEDAGQGTVFLPISRFRIPAGCAGRPVDPIILYILAEENPQGFAALIQDFKDLFKVLTPAEALALGTKDQRFAVEQYFKLGGENER